jgi:peptidoglycan/xylan/chitin deacetylase (PgdA/CDA1 family)
VSTRMMIAVGFASLGIVVSAAQQPPTRMPGDNQPGRKWSETQLKQFAGVVSAGRKLTPKSWPNGARVAVALTFSLSNTANNLARGNTAVVQLTGGEFGAVAGLPRVLAVLDRQNVPATFFVAATAAVVDPQMLPELGKRRQIEIGTLGWSDENPLEINDATTEEQLLGRATEYLTKMTGKKPAGARGPSSVLSLHTIGILKKAGFLYDSTMMAMDEPYEILLNGRPSGIVELPVSRLLDDQPTLTAPRFGPSTLPSPELVFETFRDDFDAAYDEGTLYLITLHPHLIGMRSRIQYLDDLITYIKSKPNVWFATSGEIVRYVKQQAGMTNF